jgi:hypothetical protein
VTFVDPPREAPVRTPPSVDSVGRFDAELGHVPGLADVIARGGGSFNSRAGPLHEVHAFITSSGDFDGAAIADNPRSNLTTLLDHRTLSLRSTSTRASCRSLGSNVWTSHALPVFLGSMRTIHDGRPVETAAMTSQRLRLYVPEFGVSVAVRFSQ